MVYVVIRYNPGCCYGCGVVIDKVFTILAQAEGYMSKQEALQPYEFDILEKEIW